MNLNEFKLKTIPALKKTNLDSASFPWNNIAPGLTKRWELPIPVKSNGEARAIKAMNQIEKQLGAKIFDRTSIATTPSDEISRGLIVSIGTAYLKPGTDPKHACGGVSVALGKGDWPFPAVTAYGVLSHRLYISIDSPTCIASQAVVIHEFGHAMGMGEHFRGFGDGPPISKLFWQVLRTIYANAPGTQLGSITAPA